ncbi:class I SAM-dependent methyltransferase [Flindersiella endophytica]
MSKRTFKARSADGPMMFPALEAHYPPAQRIADDPDAIAMLSSSVRLTVRAMRWPWLRGVIVRSLDKQLPGLWGGMVGRKRYADDAVTDALAAGIGQFVILGAGFDTRSFRLIGPAGAEAYEVDLPDNVARKQELLRKRFGGTPDHVTQVSTDFETDDLTERLTANGFEPNRSAMFVVEAVTQYLTDDAAQRLFSFLADAPAGSRLVFTYVDQDFLDGKALDGWEPAYRKWVVEDKVWTWGLHPTAVADFLRGYGWTEREQVGAEDYHERYFAPAGRDLTAMSIERFVFAVKPA